MKMSSNKAFLLAGLLLVAITLVVSTALADTSVDDKNLDAGGEKTSSEASAGPQRSCRCCRWGPYGSCHGYCCKTPNGGQVVMETETQGDQASPKSKCHCCRWGSHGKCSGYCCKTPNGNDMFIDIDTVNEAAEESKPLNDEIQDGHPVAVATEDVRVEADMEEEEIKGGAGGGNEDKP